MIFKSAYKKIKILKDAFRAQGYFESTPDKNGEFFLLKKISKHYQIFFDLGFYKGKISFFLRKINKNILIFAYVKNIIYFYC